MSTKWNVLLDKDGNPTAAGFIVFEPTSTQTVDSYPDVDKGILAQIRAKKPVLSDCCQALMGIDASLLTGELKIAIEVLQEKYG